MLGLVVHHFFSAIQQNRVRQRTRIQTQKRQQFAQPPVRLQYPHRRFEQSPAQSRQPRFINLRAPFDFETVLVTQRPVMQILPVRQRQHSRIGGREQKLQP